jgi:hypothetical protein
MPTSSPAFSRSRFLKTTGATKKEKNIILPIQQTRLKR